MLLSCIILFLVMVYWPTSLFWNDDVLWARGISNYADWPIHFAQANKIHYQTLVEWYTKNPYWADAPSGLLLSMGLPFKTAFLIPSVGFTMLFIYCIYKFLKKRGLSENLIGAVLVLFLFASMPNSEETQPQLWLNIFSPNRGLLLSFSLLLIIYDTFENLLNSEITSSWKRRLLTWAKLSSITFLLCLAHAHTLMSAALVATVFTVAFFKKKRAVPIETIAWALTSLAIILTFKFYIWNDAGGSYPIFKPMWTQERFGVNPLLFWPMFGGLIFLLGIYYSVRNKRYIELSLIASLTVLHLLFQWQSNAYDNVENTILTLFLCSVLIVEFIPNKKVLAVLSLISILPSVSEWTELYPITTKAQAEYAEEMHLDIKPNYSANSNDRRKQFVPMFKTVPSLLKNFKDNL